MKVEATGQPLLDQLNRLPKNARIYATFLNPELQRYQMTGRLRKDIQVVDERQILDRFNADWLVSYHRSAWMSPLENQIHELGPPSWQVSFRTVPLTSLTQVRIRGEP
jgi:hypothetical protein